MFFLFISNTDLARVPGLSAAGANVDVLPLTAPADADVMRFGRPRSIDFFPLDPDGHPTPALVTRAAVLCADIPVCVARVGTLRPPAPPYVEFGVAQGCDPRMGAAVPDAQKIFKDASFLARDFTRTTDRVMLAESVPGGTTTALLILRALGYDGMVSSAGPFNPTSLKERIWDEASARVGIKTGGMSEEPMRAITELGDPMQAAVLGFINGFEKKKKIALAGGTQMLAIAACLRAMGDRREITVATTKYVLNDKTTSFSELAEKIGVETYSA
ncbi:MAG: nicotinate-nucleotide--dimethylbenzimidazole phosphoribosyltransferase, partial [Synergistaceae bacterium]|nr:nicotinate-nucleotide--dimethylbenzimidazole phosphoribosyltransferase [Synergistaceae bacterium]